MVSVGVGAREITGHRAFADFDDYWVTILGGPSVGRQLAAMASEGLALFRVQLRAPHRLTKRCS